MTRKRSKILRLSVAALIVLPGFLVSIGTSSAAPSKAQVDSAKAKLDALNHQAEILSEQLNTATAQWQALVVKQQAAKQQMDTAQAAAELARHELNLRETAAYTSQGSQLGGLLGSESFSDFSDRVAYMSAIAGHDADLATKYQSAQIQADAARQTFEAAAADARKQQQIIADRKAQIDAAAAKAKDYYTQIYGSWHAAQVAAAKAAAAAARAAEQGGSSSGTPPPGGTGDGTPPPPPNANAADTAIYYAKSVIGTPYVWGGASPSGFDCSGLVMWSYAHAGISLPHSSAMMAAMLPHVTRAQLVPGDLVFFYSPVSHVGLYIGGGYMVDADHPGAGGEVNIRSVDAFGSFVYGGRISG
ncbi:MAG: peptidoglycan DL-endopeptidase CwlO [Actinomycetota bacterium]|jgi:cell wall-associated NlpC family hydrolase|nr:peptidoglycan DL-endopeptidase CwlO [Actinomycetota bacterium]